MQLTAQSLDLRLSAPFRIARSVQTGAFNVLVRLEAGGHVGIGEAAPSPYYGEKRESVLMALDAFAAQLGDDPLLIEDIMGALDHALGGNAAAKAAINMALYDLLGQRLGLPLYALLGLNPARTPLTSYTIAIANPDAMAAHARAAREYPILKIKLGAGHEVETMRAIRAASDATVRVDANAAWTPREAVRIIAAIAEYGVEFVEQPVPATDLEGLRFVREHSPVPIIADESCVRLDSVPRMAGRVDGINIKLAKCGGVTAALRMIHAARAHHLQVMLGCMIESSLSITAAAHLSPLADYADLDGALLIAHDPFDGVCVRDGKLLLSDRPGLGVRTRDEPPEAATQ